MRWDELNWAELSWAELSWAELSWAERGVICSFFDILLVLRTWYEVLRTVWFNTVSTEVRVVGVLLMLYLAQFWSICCTAFRFRLRFRRSIVWFISPLMKNKFSISCCAGCNCRKMNKRKKRRKESKNSRNTKRNWVGHDGRRRAVRCAGLPSGTAEGGTLRESTPILIYKSRFERTTKTCSAALFFVQIKTKKKKRESYTYEFQNTLIKLRIYIQT